MSRFAHDETVVVTGAGGLVGRALVDQLKSEGYTNVVALRSADLDLRDRQGTQDMFASIEPRYVFHCAARVYGIKGNMDNKATSFLDNVLINTHVVEAACCAGVEKVVAMGSGCVYPYPSNVLVLQEAMLWNGLPHPSEDSYAHAKRAMLAHLRACEEQHGLSYAFVISGNLYGPHDKFDTEYGHVTPSLIRKFCEAGFSDDPIVVWGDGSARRDFMYATDVAKALTCILRNVSGPVNMGSGSVSSIRDIVDVLSEITGYGGRVVWDQNKPNGQEYRAYDLSVLGQCGFAPEVRLREGLQKTYDWYLQHRLNART